MLFEDICLGGHSKHSQKSVLQQKKLLCQDYHEVQNGEDIWTEAGSKIIFKRVNLRNLYFVFK